jgi:hypothetical protein
LHQPKSGSSPIDHAGHDGQIDPISCMVAGACLFTRLT